ncbi:MAG: hypothetical protein CMA10_04560 [Euryarchaeota archaeon]|nr:hypothetical protein [Euryarchaeota archaeon]
MDDQPFGVERPEHGAAAVLWSREGDIRDLVEAVLRTDGVEAHGVCAGEMREVFGKLLEEIDRPAPGSLGGGARGTLGYLFSTKLIKLYNMPRSNLVVKRLRPAVSAAPAPQIGISTAVAERGSGFVVGLRDRTLKMEDKIGHHKIVEWRDPRARWASGKVPSRAVMSGAKENTFDAVAEGQLMREPWQLGPRPHGDVSIASKVFENRSHLKDAPMYGQGGLPGDVASTAAVAVWPPLDTRPLPPGFSHYFSV